jgi:hypothetical protein
MFINLQQKTELPYATVQLGCNRSRKLSKHLWGVFHQSGVGQMVRTVGKSSSPAVQSTKTLRCKICDFEVPIFKDWTKAETVTIWMIAKTCTSDLNKWIRCLTRRFASQGMRSHRDAISLNLQMRNESDAIIMKRKISKLSIVIIICSTTNVWMKVMWSIVITTTKWVIVSFTPPTIITRWRC